MIGRLVIFLRLLLPLGGAQMCKSLLGRVLDDYVRIQNLLQFVGKVSISWLSRVDNRLGKLAQIGVNHAISVVQLCQLHQSEFLQELRVCAQLVKGFQFGFGCVGRSVRLTNLFIHSFAGATPIVVKKGEKTRKSIQKKRWFVVFLGKRLTTCIYENVRYKGRKMFILIETVMSHNFGQLREIWSHLLQSFLVIGFVLGSCKLGDLFLGQLFVILLQKQSTVLEFVLKLFHLSSYAHSFLYLTIKTHRFRQLGLLGFVFLIDFVDHFGNFGHFAVSNTLLFRNFVLHEFN